MVSQQERLIPLHVDLYSQKAFLEPFGECEMRRARILQHQQFLSMVISAQRIWTQIRSFRLISRALAFKKTTVYAFAFLFSQPTHHHTSCITLRYYYENECHCGWKKIINWHKIKQATKKIMLDIWIVVGMFLCALISDVANNLFSSSLKQSACENGHKFKIHIFN